MVCHQSTPLSGVPQLAGEVKRGDCLQEAALAVPEPSRGWYGCGKRKPPVGDGRLVSCGGDNGILSEE